MQTWELLARELVRDTLAAYNAGTDRFRPPEIAACFCPEGVLEFPGTEPLVGRDQILAALSGLRSKPETGTTTGGRPAPTHVRHHVTNVLFREVTPDSATVTSYFSVFTDVGLDHWGIYRDVLEPVVDRWLLRSRRISVDGFAAGSLMRGAG